jgi:hypothetical protein
MIRDGVSFVAGAVVGALIALWRRPPKDETPPTPERKPMIEEHVLQALYDKKLETTAGSLDRSQSAAKFIETAAAAVATLYTGALTLVFAADGTPLPWRGFVPTGFLAFAVGFAAVYLAFITRPPLVGKPQFIARDDYLDRLQIMSQTYSEWISGAVRSRQGFLRAAVVSLVIGVALLPMPFLELPAEEPLASTTAVEFPEPQFESPVELAAIAYQAQINRFVETLKPTPASDEAENTIAFISIGVGAALVLATLVITWWGDTRPFRRWA